MPHQKIVKSESSLSAVEAIEPHTYPDLHFVRFDNTSLQATSPVGNIFSQRHARTLAAPFGIRSGVDMNNQNLLSFLDPHAAPALADSLLISVIAVSPQLV